MAGPEYMTEPQPGNSGGAGGPPEGGGRPPAPPGEGGPPGGPENPPPPTPEEALVNLLVRAAASPAFTDAIDARLQQVLGEQRGGRPQRSAERESMPQTEFKGIVAKIKELERQPNLNEAQLEELKNERGKRERLRNEVHGFGWLTPVKEELFDLHYDSRVKVDRDQKLGSEEWKRRSGGQPGRLELLKRKEQEAAVYSWEGSYLDEGTKARGFWNSALVRAKADQMGVTVQQLFNTYGGVIDDFHEESLKMIRAVVVNRNMFYREGLEDVAEKHHLISDEYYRNNGLNVMDPDGYSIWDFVWKSDYGRTFYLKNFDDIRDIVEHERRKKYFVPNTGDYESWIKLVADDVEEVEESLPYILSNIKSKFGTGKPDEINQELQQETTKIKKALEKFGYDLGYERELPEYRAFRMLQSKLAHNLNLLKTYEFSDLAYVDWQPYLQAGGDLARGFHDTEYQVGIPDAILLGDREGLMMLALQEFEANDGEYWRYGSNNADTPKHFKQGDARAWQERRKDEIKERLLYKELKSMRELLNADFEFAVENGRRVRRLVTKGEPTHPAFQRLKAKFEALDEEDRKAGKPLVDVYGKEMTRWEEYCEKALVWQRNEIFTEEITVKNKEGKDAKVIRRIYPIGDVTDYKQRVLFQHPLARSLTEEEFNLMYKDVDRNDPVFKRGLAEKERKINSIVGYSVDSVGTAERFARAFQEDAAAGLARHLVSFEQMKAIGLIPADTPLDGNGRINYRLDGEGFPLDAGGRRIPRELLRYAVDPDGKPILDNNKLIPEAIAHKVLLKQLCQLAMKYDWEGVEGNEVKQRTMRFKLSYALIKKGIARSLPLFSNWYLGAHDSIRPNWLGDIEKALPGFAKLMKDKNQVRKLDSDDEFGGDEKTVLTRVVEDEREFVELMEMYIRDQFPNYFNYPGHDMRGGGNKEARNLFLLPYGQSRGTVEMNAMIPHIWLGETDFLSAYGCSNWREFIGIYKLSDEADYKAQGSLFETPRDAEYWFRRVGAIIEQQKGWIADTDKGKAVLNAGWGSGFFLWRALNRAADFVSFKKEHEIVNSEGEKIRVNQFTTMSDPAAAYKQLDERTYESYVKLAFQFAAPLISIFEARQKLENVYGRSPGTAKFLNTLTWHAVSRWMDTSYEEFRGKYGNALDVNLHLARKFLHTALFESKLIFSDEEMDQRMLGYTIPEAVWKTIKDTDWDKKSDDEKLASKPIKKIIRYKVNADGETIAYTKDKDGRVVFNEKEIVKGERVHGLLDAFPLDIQKIILARHNNHDKSWILPMGLNSEYPETLGIIKQLQKRGEHPGMSKIYMSLLEPLQFRRQTRQRTDVERKAA